MINFNEQPTTSTAEITPVIAGEIYALIKEYGDADKAFKLKGNSDYEPEHFAIVQAELDRLGGLLASMKAGSYIIEPEYPATETEEAVPAVYLDPEDTKSFKNYLSSELLNIDTLLIDLA